MEKKKVFSKKYVELRTFDGSKQIQMYVTQKQVPDHPKENNLRKRGPQKNWTYYAAQITLYGRWVLSW
jgi:hypothetical protein